VRPKGVCTVGASKAVCAGLCDVLHNVQGTVDGERGSKCLENVLDDKGFVHVAQIMHYQVKYHFSMRVIVPRGVLFVCGRGVVVLRFALQRYATPYRTGQREPR
jgi:hypothetical protein